MTFCLLYTSGGGYGGASCRARLMALPDAGAPERLTNPRSAAPEKDGAPWSRVPMTARWKNQPAAANRRANRHRFPG